MPRLLRNLFNDEPGSTKARVVALYALLLTFNLGAWVWAFAAFHRFPVLLGTAFLAYSFGLRHAVDADHIAAIDNVTRKLMQQGKRPVTVGLMFSLGHSTIVVVGSLAIAATALALQHRIDGVREVGGVIGTLVSTLFLFAIALVNLVVLHSVYRSFMRVRSGEPYVDEDFDMLLGNRGFLSRLFRPMFNLIQRSWHMYPLGFLFGLVPHPVCRGHVADRRHRQCADAGRLRLGLREAHPQALLQHHDYQRVSGCGPGGGRH